MSRGRRAAWSHLWAEHPCQQQCVCAAMGSWVPILAGLAASNQHGGAVQPQQVPVGTLCMVFVQTPAQPLPLCPPWSLSHASGCPQPPVFSPAALTFLRASPTRACP